MTAYRNINKAIDDDMINANGFSNFPNNIKLLILTIKWLKIFIQLIWPIIPLVGIGKITELKNIPYDKNIPTILSTSLLIVFKIPKIIPAPIMNSKIGI